MSEVFECKCEIYLYIRNSDFVLYGFNDIFSQILKEKIDEGTNFRWRNGAECNVVQERIEPLMFKMMQEYYR